MIPAERILLRRGQRVPLTPKSFETLLLLAQNAGHLVQKDVLLQTVWKDTFVGEGSLAHSISVLRKLLGKTPDGNQYIETVSRHGYRFVAPVEVAVERLKQNVPAGSSAGAAEIHSLAVLPLENLSGKASQEYFADGMTEALITGLAQIVPLRVISRTSVMQYKGARKALPQIGKELHVDAIVEGTVFRAGKRVRVTVQLIHASTDRHLWTASYERDLRDVLSLQRELASAVAREITGELNLPRKAQRRRATPRLSPEAFEAYLKGRYHWNQRTEPSLKKCISFYSLAIAKDPQYALAYAGFAELYSFLSSRNLGGLKPWEAMAKAKEAAKKAVALDQNLAEAHTSLGWIKFQFGWEWHGAEKEFRHALSLNPNSATSHYRYALYLATMSRVDEASAEMRRAAELDPLSPIIPTAMGRILHFQRRYDEAIEFHRKALAMEPQFVEAHFNLGLVYEQKAMFREAISEFRKVRHISGGWGSIILSGLGHAYGMAGLKKQARKILTELKRLGSKESSLLPSNDIAWVYLGLGDYDAAISWMEKAYGERCGALVYNAVEPALDPLRAEPRFIDLLRRIGLPQPE